MFAVYTTALIALAGGSTNKAGTTREPFITGVTVSCPGHGRIWGSPLFSSAIEDIKQLGAQWVAIHPYARVLRDGTIQFTPAEETGFLAEAVARARQGRMHLFWKPHLAYWGSFEWRGAIDFGENRADWERFFDGYERFIVDQAKFAARHRLPLLSVGIEYKATHRWEHRWRRIIEAVRQVYPGKITYAANWDEVHVVPFWDVLDYIGVQAYFPLSDQDRPSPAELREGWDRYVATLVDLSKRNRDMPIIFTEIGYARSRIAAKKPWEPEFDTTNEAIQLRRTLMDLALSRVSRTPQIHGMFWWKWLPGSNRFPFDERDFSLKDPEAREALTKAWKTRTN